MISGDLQTYTSLHTLIFRVLYSVPIYDILFLLNKSIMDFGFTSCSIGHFDPKMGSENLETKCQRCYN